MEDLATVYDNLCKESQIKEHLSASFTEIDAQIIKAMLQSGYDIETVRQVVKKKSPALRNKPLSYVELYLKKQIEERDFQIEHLPWHKSVQDPEEFYQSNKLNCALQVEKKLFEKDVHISLELIDKGYKLRDIQECLLNKSVFASEIKDKNLIIAYCDRVMKNINKKRALQSGKLFELAQNLYLQKAAAIQGKYEGYHAYNEFQEGKVIVSMLMESHFFPEIIEKVLRKSTQNKAVKNIDAYVDLVMKQCTDVKKAYLAIAQALPKGMTKAADLYKLFAKEYLEKTHKIILTGKDDQKIIKRMFSEKMSGEQIREALKEASPVSMELGRKSDRYIEVTMSVVSSEYEKKQHFLEKNYATTEEAYLRKITEKEQILKNKNYAHTINHNRSYYDGIVARELLQEKQYVPNIVKSIAIQSPLAKKESIFNPQKTPESYGRWIVNSVSRVLAAENKILNILSRNIPKGYSWFDLKKQNVKLADLYQAAVKERIEVYPSTALNLEAGYIDKDACEKLVQRYPDLKKEELEEAIHEASPRAQMPGIPRDYPALVVEEVLDRMEKIQTKEVESKEIQKEYLQQCGLASEGVEAKANIMEYYQGRSATNMLISGVAASEVYQAVLEGAKAMEGVNPELYAQSIMSKAEKVKERLYDLEIINIQNPETPKEVYQTKFQNMYKDEGMLSSTIDITIATELLLSGKCQADELKSIVEEISPMAVEPGRNQEYLDFIKSWAEAEFAQEKKKLETYELPPRVDPEKDIGKEYDYLLNDLEKQIRLPASKEFDVIVSRTLYEEGFSGEKVKQCLNTNSQFASQTEKQVNYGEEIVKGIVKAIEKLDVSENRGMKMAHSYKKTFE